jgi:hypothetical protein
LFICSPIKSQPANRPLSGFFSFFAGNAGFFHFATPPFFTFKAFSYLVFYSIPLIQRPINFKLVRMGQTPVNGKAVIARSEATKQSKRAFTPPDCFARQSAVSNLPSAVYRTLAMTL